MKKIILIILVILFAGCGLKKEFEFTGQAMGTSYHIKIVTWYFKNMDDMKTRIEDRLEAINRSMSTFMPDSEISRFNLMNETGKKFTISNDFLEVAYVAKNIYEITNGAWDGTVMPLVKLWGFSGSNSDIYEMRTDIPDEKKIRKILTEIGFDKIEVSEQGYLKKLHAFVSIDFASIAKGYAVDQVANIVKKKGIDDFLVEIGGEVYASGYRLDGRNWRVGVNVPRKDSPQGMVYEAVDIKNKALATSGDYRNFFEVNGKYYSHILDPITGYPVINGVVSVSIIADTCVFADGLATGILVMGQSKGMELINSLEGVECLLVVNEEGKLTNYYSKGFKAYH